jgi:hypothetical protein
MNQKVLLVVSIVVGLLVAVMDSLPKWDDTGITVLALIAGGGIIGYFVLKHPWLFALTFGIWIPLWGIITRHDLMMLIVLFFPFAGVFAGWAVRKLTHNLLHSSR